MNNIFITGGTGKIGGQIVAHFFKLGWNVTTTSRKKENIFNLTERNLLPREACGKIDVIEVDFSSSDCVKKIESHFLGKPNNLPQVLVNNARSIAFLKVNEQGTSDRSFLLNEYLIDVVIPYELSILFANWEASSMKSIINVSSIYGVVPFNPNLYDDYLKSAPIQYSLAKSALIHLTKELAIRFAKKKIKVNTVSFGGVEGRVSNEFKERYASLCPEGGMLKEEDTIGPIDFLASDKSNGITGHNLIQDGGWTIW